jgi:hypothetical protein
MRFDGLTIQEAVFQAIGAASVCWEHPEKAGVFDSDRAKDIGNGLLDRLGLPMYGPVLVSDPDPDPDPSEDLDISPGGTD